MNYIETICIKDSVPQNLEYHLARMRRIGAVELPDIHGLNSICEGRVKCRVVYNSSEIVSVEFSRYELPAIHSLRVVESATIEYDKKSEDRGELKALYLERGSSDDIVICRDGRVGDSYFCNLVFSRDGKLFTPDTPLLHGTKRQMLIDNGIITPCRITRDDLSKYQSVRLINAMIDLADNITVPIEGVVLE